MRQLDPISALVEHYDTISTQTVREDPVEAVFAARSCGQNQLVSALIGVAVGLIPAALLLALAARPSGDNGRAANAIARQQMLNSGLVERTVKGERPAIR